MRKLLTRIWNAEPVILVGAITSAWTAIVAFDQIDDSWAIHTWLYVTAVPLIAFLAAITHKHAQHTDDDDYDDYSSTFSRHTDYVDPTFKANP